MNISIELDQLTCNGITLNQYLFLNFIYEDNKIGLSAYMNVFPECFSRNDVDNMIAHGFLTSNNEGEEKYMLKHLQVTEKFNIFVPLQVQDWIEEWYSLWPQGVKSGGYYVKSDKTGCKNKLQKFLKNNPTITKDIIIQATKNYITEQEYSGYKYMRMAPYFVEKNGLSALSGYCEAIMENYAQDSGESKFIEEA